MESSVINTKIIGDSFTNQESGGYARSNLTVENWLNIN